MADDGDGADDGGDDDDGDDDTEGGDDGEVERCLNSGTALQVRDRTENTDILQKLAQIEDLTSLCTSSRTPLR